MAHLAAWSAAELPSRSQCSNSVSYRFLFSCAGTFNRAILGTDFVCESNQFMKQVGVLTVVIHQDTIVHMLLVE